MLLPPKAPGEEPALPSGGFWRPLESLGWWWPRSSPGLRGPRPCPLHVCLPLPLFRGRASFASGPTWIIQDDPILS